MQALLIPDVQNHNCLLKCYVKQYILVIIDSKNLAFMLHEAVVLSLEIKKMHICAPLT